MTSRMTPSSKSPVRNLQRPPSMTSRTGGSWGTSKHARELKFGTQVKNHISWRSMMLRMTPSSKYPVRNHQHPPSMTLRMRSSWHTSIHARELKFGTQVKHHISWWSMMSRMTPSSRYPVRNLQHPPSMTSRMGGSWLPSYHARELKFGTMSSITYDDIHIKNPYISAKLCHIFTKLLGLVPEGPPNCKYMVDGTHLLQLVALFN